MNLITHLKPNEVIVIGTNLRGRHGAGAALYASQHFGLEEGQWFGPSGRCYGIPTRDENIQTLPLVAIWQYVDAFKAYAERKLFNNMRFLVTPIGCGLAGYQPKDIAKMFRGSPANVVLPPEFLVGLDQGGGGA